MSLSATSAVQILSSSAEGIGDDRVTQRLQSVQALLADDLQWVEAALCEAAKQGTAPAIGAARHLLEQGGKRVRPTAVLLSAACFAPVAPSAARELSVVVELVHTATLLHDDVIDEGMERRGSKTSRMLWGNAVSVLSGDTLLVYSLQRTLEHAPALMGGLLETLQSLVSGEILQLRGRTQLDLSQTTYERILNDKTASLFRFATSSGARLAGANELDQARLGEFGERVGMAFQLVDDMLDYAGNTIGKTLGADLKEGKVTLPLVVAVQRRPELFDRVQAIRNGDDAGLAELREAVVGTGACDEVRKRAQRETRLAIQALEGIQPSPARSLLVAVAQQMAIRGS